MDVKIRNINPTAVKKIDELAREKKLSRNEYLRIMVENFSGLEAFTNFEERYQNLLHAYQITVEKNTQLLTEIESALTEE